MRLYLDYNDYYGDAGWFLTSKDDKKHNLMVTKMRDGKLFISYCSGTNGFSTTYIAKDFKTLRYIVREMKRTSINFSKL